MSIKDKIKELEMNFSVKKGNPVRYQQNGIAYEGVVWEKNGDLVTIDVNRFSISDKDYTNVDFTMIAKEPDLVKIPSINIPDGIEVLTRYRVANKEYSTLEEANEALEINKIKTQLTDFYMDTYSIIAGECDNIVGQTELREAYQVYKLAMAIAPFVTEKDPFIPDEVEED